jgi:hypothetical protein
MEYPFSSRRDNLLNPIPGKSSHKEGVMFLQGPSSKTVALLFFMVCASTALRGQVSQVPIKIELQTSAKEIKAGEKLTLNLDLRNYNNQSVQAISDTVLTISSDTLGKPVSVVIPKGQNSLRYELTPPSAGVFKFSVSSQDLAPASSLIVVRPAAKTGVDIKNKASELVVPTAPDAQNPGLAASTRTEDQQKLSAPVNMAEAARTMANRSEVEAPAGAAGANPRVAFKSPPSAIALSHHGVVPQIVSRSPASIGLLGGISTVAPSSALTGTTTPSRIDMEVFPAELYPEKGLWKTSVVVLVVDSGGQIINAAMDLPVLLAARLGSVSPKNLVIKAGESSTLTGNQTIDLLSNKDGIDVVQALSGAGQVQKEVRYDLPTPSKLRIEANPKQVVNDGRTWVDISLFLMDDTNRLTYYQDRDVKVILTSTFGSLDHDQITIPKGQSFAGAKLTSVRHGLAEVSAALPAFDASKTSVQFLFPWLMIVLASTGGVIGGVVREAKDTFSADSGVAHLWRDIVVGLACGLVFYILALSGAVASVPKIEVNIAAIPTGNELGAFALGFIGGIVGRAFWKVE